MILLRTSFVPSTINTEYNCCTLLRIYSVPGVILILIRSTTAVRRCSVKVCGVFLVYRAVSTKALMGAISISLVDPDLLDNTRHGKKSRRLPDKYLYE